MQLLLAGRKRQEDWLGYAADFCPICRDLEPFAVTRVEISNVLDGVVLQQDETVGYCGVCQACGFGAAIEKTRFTRFVPTLPPSIDELTAATHPDAAVHYSQRLSLENDFRRDAACVPADVRLEMVKEPFLALAYQSSYIEPIQARPGMIAALTVAILGPIGLMLLHPPTPVSDRLAGLFFFGGLACVLWGALVDSLAKRRREPKALLLKALRPLRPTRDELETVLNRESVQRNVIWKGETAERILSRLQLSPLPAPPRQLAAVELAEKHA